MKKKMIHTLVAISIALTAMTGCSKTDSTTSDVKEETLFIYCGAGMKQPFAEIADLFESETIAEVEVTYGNAAQIITQIQTSNQGDLFIAGDQGELDSIQEDYVSDTKSLVKHIPVIVVQTDNPKEITGVNDLAKEGVTVVFGDSEATPIGKIADKALKDEDITGQVNILARTTTAPEIMTALSLGQCDASIVWKENADVEGIEILDCHDMDNYIKTIPAASLTCSTNQEALEAFLSFLDTQEVKDVWLKYGYELIN